MSIDPTKALGFETDEVKCLCTDRDAILYSLGIGYSQDPMNVDDHAYTYELHDDFKIFPTFSTCLHRTDIFKVIQHITIRHSHQLLVSPISIQ